MNEQFTHDMNEMDVLLTQTADNTHPNPHFIADLEQSLAEAHRDKSKPGWFHFTYKQAFTALAWTVSLVVFALIMSWAIRNVVPSPTEVPAANNTSAPQLSSTPTYIHQDITVTPLPPDKSFDFRGAKLMVNTELPEAQGEANVYAFVVPQPASAEYARTLAERFGIQGEVYTTQPVYPYDTAFMVTDGKQRLIVISENNYTYVSDIATNSRNANGYQFNNAESLITDYLQTHGFNNKFQLIPNSLFSGYVLQQLSPDGLPMSFESYSQPSIRVALDQNGGILSLSAALIKYDPAPIGSFGILNPQEALQNLLNDTQSGGKIESGHSGPKGNYTPPEEWYHDYPDNKTVTLAGQVTINTAFEAGKPAAIFIDDNVLVSSATSGMEALDNYSLVQVTGQFVVENGTRKFNVERWTQNIQQVSATGYAHLDGNRIIISNEDGSKQQYTLIDPPADLPLDTSYPESYLFVNGVADGDQLRWSFIQYIADASQMGGGGGGGGLGFYQLNLSGTPVPFPTLVPQGRQYTPAELAGFARYLAQNGDTLTSIAADYNISLADLMRANYVADASTPVGGWQLVIPGVPGPTRVDGARGIVTVQILQKPDGRERTMYTFVEAGGGQYYELLGDNLDALQVVAKRPLQLWGTISHNDAGFSFITVEKFAELYPDLKFQVLEGTQTSMPGPDGQQLVLLQANGNTYIQMDIGGAYPDSNMFDGSPDVYVEGLLIPDETYQGYPALRVLNASPGINPANGEKLTYQSVVGNIDTMPDPYGNSDNYSLPDIVIDSLELEYYASSADNQPNGITPFLQPAWHFQGHNSNGDIVDFLIQALKPEYLSPELSNYTPPG